MKDEETTTIRVWDEGRLVCKKKLSEVTKVGEPRPWVKLRYWAEVQYPDLFCSFETEITREDIFSRKDSDD